MSADPTPHESGSFHRGPGIWIRLRRNALAEPRGALFLDRDGVIIVEKDYLSRPSGVELVSGAAELIASANRLGIPVVEITNQSGIARGFFGWREFEAVEANLTEQLAAAGAAIDAVLACPYHADGIPPWNLADHPARKPRPGMLLEAARRLNLDLSQSWIAGDKQVDIQAGWNAGLRGGLHVMTGHGAAHRQLILSQNPPANFELRLGDSIRDVHALLPLLTRPG